MRDWRDIGAGVAITPFTHGEGDDVGGYFVRHYHDGELEPCIGTVYIVQFVNRPCWRLLSSDPRDLDHLTLEPSIAQHSDPTGTGEMHQCLHGYIRAGRWIPA